MENKTGIPQAALRSVGYRLCFAGVYLFLLVFAFGAVCVEEETLPLYLVF
jgi:hypothetical protein